MIISRSPLRISLGGGGTDLKSYYSLSGGFLITAAINKYVYITVHRSFKDFIVLKYWEMEKVRTVSEIKHPIFREAMKLLKVGPRLELCSIADIPAGTGLGSSGSFTVSVLHALHALKKDRITQGNLAEEACHIEIDRLKEPIGKQDQYIAAYGGLKCMEFDTGGGVTVTPLKISNKTLNLLEKNLVMFFTGYSRSASNILREQDKKTRTRDSEMTKNLDFVKSIGLKSKTAFETGDLSRFAELMNEHWEFKKQRSESMSNPEIEKWYRTALKNGALGGKLIGAGGGGFLLFYASDPGRLRKVMGNLGLHELEFSFDFEGSKILLNEINLS